MTHYLSTAISLIIMTITVIVVVLMRMQTDLKKDKQKFYSTDQVLEILFSMKGVSTASDIVIHRVTVEVERQRPKSTRHYTIIIAILTIILAITIVTLTILNLLSYDTIIRP